MSRTSVIAKNTLVQVAGRAAGTVLGLLTLGVMTRYLGTAGYGAFTTVTSFLQFFGIVVDFGLSLTVVAMLSEPAADRDRIASNLFSLRIVSAAVFFGLAPLAALFMPYPPEIRSGVLVAAASFFFIALNQILTGVLQKELRMARAAAAEVIGRFGLLAGAFAVARLDLGLGWMLAALIVGNGLTALWNWLLVRKLVDVSWRFEPAVWKEILHRSWPIGLSIIFNLIYLKGDVIILSLTRPQSEVGVYGAAYKILDVVTVVPIMFMGLVLPLMVRAWKERSLPDLRRFLQKSFDFMIILALPLVLGGIAVGPELMRLFAGEAFADAGRLLQILIIAAGAVFFGSMFGHAVIAVERQKPMVWGYAADAAVSTAAYLILIPRWGAVGAAWVTVLSEAFIAAATFLMVYRSSRFLPDLRVGVKALLSAAIMAAAIRAVPDLHVLIKVVLGAGLYAGALFLTKTISRSMIADLVGQRPGNV